MKDTFKDVSKRGWVVSFFRYMIDSRYRTTKALDSYLNQQITYPHKDLVKVAKMLRAKSKNPDDLIIKILRYVNNRVRYVTDQSNFNQIEKWAGAYDAWSTRKGDCDDQNILIYVLARLGGISDLVLWSAIGTTDFGGHYWNIYFSPKTGWWYPIDSTYHVDLRTIPDRKIFRFGSRSYKEIWYLFNERAILKQK